MTDAASTTPLGDIADCLLECADDDRVSVGDMLEAAGRASYGPMLLLLALVTLSPIGAIPGASILTGILFVLLGAQMMARQRDPWLPSWIERRSVSGDLVERAVHKSRSMLSWVDRLPQPRMQAMSRGPWTYAVAIGVIGMGLLMFPLAFVPWGVWAVAFPLIIVSLGLIGHDGVLTVAGLIAMGAGVFGSAYLIDTVLL